MQFGEVSVIEPTHASTIHLERCSLQPHPVTYKERKLEEENNNSNHVLQFAIEAKSRVSICLPNSNQTDHQTQQ